MIIRAFHRQVRRSAPVQERSICLNRKRSRITAAFTSSRTDGWCRNEGQAAVALVGHSVKSALGETPHSSRSCLQTYTYRRTARRQQQRTPRGRARTLTRDQSNLLCSHARAEQSIAEAAKSAHRPHPRRPAACTEERYTPTEGQGLCKGLCVHCPPLQRPRPGSGWPPSRRWRKRDPKWERQNTLTCELDIIVSRSDRSGTHA